jgi:hypothetical protein
MWLQRLTLTCDRCGTEVVFILGSHVRNLNALVRGAAWRLRAPNSHLCPQCARGPKTDPRHG